MSTYTNPHYGSIGANQYFQLKYKDLNLVMIFVYRCSQGCTSLYCDSMVKQEITFKVKRILENDDREIIKSKKGTNKVKFSAKSFKFNDSIYQLDTIELDKMFNIINENWTL